MPKKLDPVHPGEILLEEFMKPLRVSQNKLARDIDVPPKRINAIVNGKNGVTADTALRLAKYFGTTPEFWVNLQAHYELDCARQDTWPKVEKNIRPLEAA